jgi:hypothetical protein
MQSVLFVGCRTERESTSSIGVKWHVNLSVDLKLWVAMRLKTAMTADVE